MQISSAKWIGFLTDESVGEGARDSAFGAPSPMFRKSFSVKKGLLSARLEITSLGIYRAYCNGTAVGNDYFTPGWTDYRKRIHYQTYDLTALLCEGENVLGAVLGDGWYTGNVAIYQRMLYGGYPLKLCAVLTLGYPDGEETVSTDTTWQASTGRIRCNDILNGEHVDNRLDKPGFFTAEYAGGDLHEVTAFERPEALLVPMREAPATVMDERGLTYLHSRGESRLYDVGQNMVGIVTATLRGDAGAVVRFRYGEMLNGDGTLYTDNLRSAQATDLFTLCGEGDELFSPLFTFHGFRYVEITVLSGRCEVSDLRAEVIYSNLRRTGEFSCSDPIVNQIYSNAFWGQRGNFVYIPTDCPQRDERMGWTGDTQVFCQSACYNMDANAFYRSYLDSCRDERMGGAITDVVPYVPVVGYGHAAWGDVITVVPYMQYLMYGDCECVKENLRAMKEWCDYLLSTTHDYIRPGGGYGDWLSIGEETDQQVMNTACFAYSALLTAQLCRKFADEGAEKYRDLYEKIREAFRRRFVGEDGRIMSDTQTCYLMAVKFGLLEGERAKPHLLRRLRENNWHLATGFVGVSYLLPVLSDLGCSEEAYRLICETTYPSWGYSVVNGATTIWERWNSWTKEGGFADISMNSFNHYSLGSCVEWLYRYVLGIRPDFERPGFELLRLVPDVDFSGRITHAEGSYDSCRGKISVSWEASDGKCVYRAQFPAEMEVSCCFERYEILSLEQKPGSVRAELARHK